MKNYNFTIDGEAFTARIVEHNEDKVVVDLNGTSYEVELAAEEPAAFAAASSPAAPVSRRPVKAPSTPSVPAAAAVPAGSGSVTAPIPGVVKQIQVAVGDKVTEDTVVIVLEAMKMENQIPAAVAGTVNKIAVALGDSVLDGQLLIQIEES